MFKNRTVQIVLGVVLALVVLAGGYFFIAGSSANPEDEYMADEVIETLSPDEIGLTITAKPNKKSVKFAIAKMDGIKSIEYQLTYEADSTKEEQSESGETRIQRGITGEVKEASGSSYESPWLDLGSCSKNVCRYDSGVKSVDLTLKIVKSNGKIYEVKKTSDL
jgi:hypothetical protein